ncbi:MAG: mucoidy inhibitor MuiA family protein [Candidatus Omnitrophica bacterium]|nr:mucoidy inhibitor MuiA family protein [Candidatus Omnitrophota bacterium]
MKTLCRSFVFGLFFVSVVSSAFAETFESPSTITAVTVYPGAAHLTRTIIMDLPVGNHTLVFDKISPPLDENTLSVSGQGSANVKIYGGYIKQEFLKKSPNQRVSEIESKIQELDDQTIERNGYSQVLEQKREYLNSIKLFAGGQLPKDLITTMPSVENLKGVGNLLADELAALEKQKNDIRIKLREIAKERLALVQELNNTNANTQNIERRLAVDVECTKAGKFTLNASYLINGAYWRPLYDARTNMAKSDVELTSFGVVKQMTGEDWHDVNLTLSTAKPNVGGRMPYVSPWVVQAYQPMMKNKGNAVAGFGGRLRSEADGIGEQYAPMSADKSELHEARKDMPAQMAYSAVAKNGLSVTYKIARPISLKSDGTENKFPIATQTLKAEFQYSANPKEAAQSYLNSDVINSSDLQLLAGQVNLFLEGDFVGKSNIENVGPGEKFSLYLGVNENVKVKREQIEKKVNDILIAGIPSANRTTTIKMKVTIENYENRPIKYNLFESLPVAQNEKQINVKVSDVNPQPTKKDWEDRKGVWQWVLDLEPKAKKEVFYTFSVEHPRDMQVEGL